MALVLAETDGRRRCKRQRSSVTQCLGRMSFLSLVHGPALAGPFLLLARQEEAGREARLSTLAE